MTDDQKTTRDTPDGGHGGDGIAAWLAEHHPASPVGRPARSPCPSRLAKSIEIVDSPDFAQALDATRSRPRTRP